MSVRRTTAARFDAYETTSVGGARVSAALTRTGVFLYLNPDGTVRREWRPESEVFAPESLATLRGVPVTDDHPPDMISPDNYRYYAVGHVHDNVERENEKVIATITVEDAKAIEAIREARKRDLSCGYTCDLDFTAGTTPDGEEYDAIQTRIRYNHVALVARGRAGSSVGIRLDSHGNEIGDPDPMNEIEKLRAEIAEVRASAIVEKTRADKAEAEAEAQRTRADKAEASAAALEASIGDRVRARADLVLLARQNAVTVREDATDTEIRKQILAVVLPTYKVDGRDDAAIATALEVATAHAPGSAEAARKDAAEAAGRGRPVVLEGHEESRADKLRRERLAEANAYSPKVFSID